MELAKSIKAKYYETSALYDSNGNCKVVFQQCAHMILNSDIITHPLSLSQQFYDEFL